MAPSTRPSRSTQRKAGRLALLPLLAAAAVVAAPNSPAAQPNAQGTYSSGGNAAGSPPVDLSTDVPRPSTRETGRKTG